MIWKSGGTHRRKKEGMRESELIKRRGMEKRTKRSEAVKKNSAGRSADPRLGHVVFVSERKKKGKQKDEWTTEEKSNQFSRL